MPLSEHEQRLLEQIERALYAEDPKFASTVRGGRLRRPPRRRRVQGIALFGIGLVLLVLGIAIHRLWVANVVPVVSILGFLVMFAGAILAVTSAGAKKRADAADGGSSAERDRNRFTNRMEERFRRRFDQD